MKKFSNLLLIFILFVGKLLAQDGNIYLHNYANKLDNHHILSIYQGHDGLMYFVNHRGIVSYDGVHWKNLKVHNTPESESVAPGSQGKVYVGCHQNFGFVKVDDLGQESYVSISNKTKVEGDITSIVFTQNKGYFYGNHALYQVNLANDKLERVWKSNPQYPFEGVFVLNNTVYINIRFLGLHKINKNNKLEKVSSVSTLANNRILASFPYDNKNILLATDSNKVYLFDGLFLKPFVIESQAYLESNLLSCGASLGKDAFALGTLSGGCILIDKKTGKTRYTINYQTGLPDDEITSLGVDFQGGIWIAHASGITRADFNLPIKKYSTYPGLEGNIISAVNLRSRLYVATSEGLFYLAKVEKLEDIEEYIRDTVYNYNKSEPMVVPEPIFKPKENHTQIVKTVTIVEKQEEGKVTAKIKDFFGIKRNKDKKNIKEHIDTVKVNKPVAAVSKKPVWKPAIAKPARSIASVKVHVKSTNRRRKEIYVLQSIPYVYKRVGGIVGKCRQIIEFNNTLLIATNSGLYELNGDVAKPIQKGIYVTFIHKSEKNPNKFFIGTQKGLYIVENINGEWLSSHIFPNLHANINTIAEDNDYLWIGAFNQILKIDYKNDVLGKAKYYNFNNGYSESIQVREIDGKVVFFFNSGILKYEPKKEKFVLDNELKKFHNHNAKFIFTQPGFAWSNSDYKWKPISYSKKEETTQAPYLDLFDKVQDIYKDYKNDLWVVHDNTLHCVKDNKINTHKYDKFTVDFRSVKDNSDKYLTLDTITLDYQNNYLSVEVSAPYYLNETATTYQYRLEGLQKGEWSKWSRDPMLDFPYLPIGSYVLHVRAKNVFGEISREKLLHVTIKPPFWRTPWFIITALICTAFIIYLVIFFRLRSLEKANKVLEQKVKERTAEVVKQKEEIIAQKEVIEDLYRDVTDSIDYAQKIQYAILPDAQFIKQKLQNAFIVFRPKNIVSGDFYWFTERADRFLIAAVDCTGHGVPGAFMSMIGNTLLNQIVNERNIVEPAEVLNQLHIGIRKLLKQDQIGNMQKDGMDLVLISVHKFRNEVQYAGANNSLYYVENEEIKEIKANKFSIGGFQKEEERKFTNHVLQVTSKTHFYLTSDGLSDQFDQAFENKFTAKRMRNLFLEIAENEADAKASTIIARLDAWRGTEEQMDDLMVLGFTLNPA